MCVYVCVYILSSSLDTHLASSSQHTHTHTSSASSHRCVSRNQKKRRWARSLSLHPFSQHSATKSHSSSVCVVYTVSVYCNHSIERETRETAHPDPKERKKRQKHHISKCYILYIIFLARHDTSRIIIATHTHISFKSYEIDVCVQEIKKRRWARSLSLHPFSQHSSNTKSHSSSVLCCILQS
jgi:hypothetical protein